MRRVYTLLELNVLCENNSLLQRKIEEGVLDLAVVMSLEKAAVGDATVPSPICNGWRRLTSPSTIGVCFRLPAIRMTDYWGPRPSTLCGPAALPIGKQSAAPTNESFLSAVSSGTAVTVMAEGSIHEGLQVVSDAQALPPLGRARIQLLQQSAPQSEAARVVKRQIASLYPGS